MENLDVVREGGSPTCAVSEEIGSRWVVAVWSPLDCHCTHRSLHYWATGDWRYQEGTSDGVMTDTEIVPHLNFKSD